MISSSSINVLLRLRLASYDIVLSGWCVILFRRNNTEECGSVQRRNGATSARMHRVIPQHVSLYLAGSCMLIAEGLLLNTCTFYTSAFTKQ
jgi:hypothetical protein